MRQRVDGRVGVELLHHGGGGSRQELRPESSDAADVRDGEDDGPHVVVGHLEPVAHGRRRDGQGGVGVAHALGLPTRARGVEDPADVGRRRRGPSRFRRRLRLGELPVEDEETPLRPLGQRPTGGRVVHAPPLGGDDEKVRIELVADEGELTPTVERQDGILDGAQAGERGNEHDGVQRIRQLPGHPRAR